MKLYPLGTNGYIPSHGRHTMSFLLVEADRALLLDAGSGVSRLLEPQVVGALAGVGLLEVLLSHYHLDHIIGLSYLPGVWRGRAVRIHAPAPPLVDGDAASGLARLLGPPLFPQRPDQWPLALEIVEYTEATLEIAGFRLQLRRQSHPGGSVGMRIDDLLAYTTDTTVDPATAELARGVTLLLHEVWWTGAELAAAPDASGHSSAEAVAELAAQAEVARIAPVHHRPDRSAADLAAIRDLMREAVPGLDVLDLREAEPVALRDS